MARITIPDDLLEEVGEDNAAALLAKARVLLDPAALVLAGQERTALVDLLGGLPLRNGKDVVDRVGRLAELRVGKIRIDFTVQEWEAIDMRAARQGKSREQYVGAMIAQFKQDWTELAVR